MNEYLYNFLIILLIIIIIMMLLFIILKLLLLCNYKSYNKSILTFSRTELSQINVLQLNTFLRPKLIHIGRQEYLEERSLMLSQALNGFDICAFNEAFQFGSSIVDRFIEMVQQNGFHFIVSSKNPGFFSRFILDSGLLIISKFPIVFHDSIIYDDGVGVDNYAAKGVLYAKIETKENSFLHIFSTHLQASYGNPTGKDVLVRQSQISQLVEFIQKNVNDNFPIILLGDLNVNSRKGTEYLSLFNELKISNFQLIDTIFEHYGEHQITFGDSDELNNPLDTVLTTEGDFNSHQCLDYIFLYKNENNNINNFIPKVESFFNQRGPFTQLSDHYGVSCLINFQDK